MQITLLCTLPPAIDEAARLRASDWRSRFVDAGVGDYTAWNRVRISAIREQLWLVASEPDGNTFLETNLDGIAGVLAATCHGPVAMERIERAVGVRTGTEKLWAYRIPRYVAEKKAGDWSAHFAAQIDSALKAKLERRIEASIRRELAAWGRLPDVLDNDQPFLVIAQPGRAVPVPAIDASRSGHGKAVHVLVRSQVVLLSYWRLEGELFAGPLAALGYGRLTRTNAPDAIDRALQRELLNILPDPTHAEVA